MKSFEKKDSLLKNREIALKKNLKKRKKIITEKKRKNDSSFRQMDKKNSKTNGNDKSFCG